MFPVFYTLRKKSYEDPNIQVKWVNTSQHKELLHDLEDFFDIKPDYNFDITKPESSNTRLGNLSSEVLKQATDLFDREKPDFVFVQGDTLTAQSCALAAFYQKIKVAHIEAGLRTNDIFNPFPEELSRRIISQIATLNFSPELTAQENLEFEKKLYKKKSYNFYTGNTVIDSLSYSMDKIASENFNWQNFNYIDEAFTESKLDLDRYINELDYKKYILITAHRRENITEEEGKTKLDNLMIAIERLLENQFVGDIEFVCMVHKNPQVRAIFEKLDLYCKKNKIKRVKFLEGASYPAFLKLMANSHFIVTDSGGIQEEAPYLKKPVLIFREHTERLAGLELGLSKLVGTKESLIHGEMLDLISNEKHYQAMIETGLQPYGDGLAASRIVDSTLLYMNK
jgi:UDP-N-acetylglucosamine 2-epimerase (non-hydrolysing)